METLAVLSSIGAVLCFVLGLWFAGQAAVDRRRLKDLQEEHGVLVKYGQQKLRQLNDKEARLREYLALHQRDQDEIKALRRHSELLIENLGDIATEQNRISGQTSDLQLAMEDRLKKIPSNPPPSGCS